MMSLNSCHTVQKWCDETKVDSRSLFHLLVMILNSINDTRTKEKHCDCISFFCDMFQQVSPLYITF